MLKPKYIEQLPAAMVELYSEVEQDILADMARRIAAYDYWIPAAEHQRKALIELGNFHSYVIKALSARTGKTAAELERLMEEAGMKALSFDVAVYREHGLDPPPLAASKELQKVLRAGLRQTSGLFVNLSRTTANTASKQFEDALDRAWLQISSGAFDSNTAIRMAVKDLSQKGVKSIQYPSGHSDTLEVAVRRATVTGVNQTALRLQDALADEMGCDLVETTAHAGARPEHAVWQGQIFSRSGKSDRYPDFVSSTGYGSGSGLGGWNCRHSFSPYFEGDPKTYSEQMLEGFEAKDYEYNGQKMTEYEATRQQRYVERQIRRWKRENAAMAAAGLDTSESASKIRQWQETQKDFLRQTGLKRQGDREQIGVTPGLEGSGESKIRSVARHAGEVPGGKAAAGRPWSSDTGADAFTSAKRKRLYSAEWGSTYKKCEEARLYDAKGTSVFRKQGDSSSVTFSATEIKAMRDGVLTHNHPNGSCFSTNDINMLRRSRLAEIRASTSRGVYRMQRPQRWSREINSLDKLQNVYDNIDKEISQPIFERFRMGEITLGQAELLSQEAVVQELAQRYGMSFRFDAWADIKGEY